MPASLTHFFVNQETEGGGLICHETGDPAEDKKLGVLVGVTSVINKGLPSLHMRVGLFNKWVTDTANRCSPHLYFVILATWVIN